MTETSALVNAVILLPAGVAIDSNRAELCLVHIERRGYRLVGIVHDWPTALTAVRAHEAEVVVFADADDFKPDWTPRIEYCGDETQDLVRYGRIFNRNESPSADPRRRRPGPVT